MIRQIKDKKLFDVDITGQFKYHTLAFGKDKKEAEEEAKKMMRRFYELFDIDVESVEVTV